ncbi:cytidine deaminase [Pseudoalteromonas ulvae UL12]|uniref:cytidine deaminase n=1 Tax=Pseudoalteromonas ulvae TaxID=107327 RepID=UPI00186BAB7C|nr:cytidine deaminase [Pseudoalteromonas ulvae]MBE0366022.1 cytidine deaminase [Pseudoalteromonas ulvae UL12]
MCKEQITSESFLSEQQFSEILSQVKANKGVLCADQVAHWAVQLYGSQDELMEALLPVAASFSRAPISQFNVGAIAVGDANEEGYCDFYFGANLEFPSQALSLVVHAEQAAINNAWLNGARKITKLAITDAPCGYCRQFMNELADAETLIISLNGEHHAFSEFLPMPFGPKELDNPTALMSHQRANLTLDDASFKVSQLVQHAEHSYVPYTDNFASSMIVCHDGSKFYGRYAENAAYSPSLSPLQSAISQLILAGKDFNQATIKAVYLAQMKGQENQTGVAKAVLDSYDFSVPLHLVALKSGV